MITLALGLIGFVFSIIAGLFLLAIGIKLFGVGFGLLVNVTIVVADIALWFIRLPFRMFEKSC